MKPRADVVVHKLFLKQLAKSRTATGDVDLKTLATLVSAAYRESERDRRRTDRSIALMIEELDQLQAGLEEEVERRTAELSQSRSELETRNALLDAALTHMSHGLAMFDADTRLVICNSRYVDMYRLPPELSMPGTALADIVRHVRRNQTNAGDCEEYVRQVVAQIDRGTASSRMLKMRDGRVIVVTRQPKEDGGWVSTHEDITENQRAQQRIAHMARHDALTDLPNRLLLHERIEQACRGQEQIAVLYVDLDRFKTINDTLGHAVGDMLLKAVAGRLRGCVKEGDLVARIGGDKFAIVQSRVVDRTDAAILAKRLCQVMNAPYDLMGELVVVQVSAGIAMGSPGEFDANDLLRNADLALHRAKHDGKGTFRFFEPEMDACMQVRRELEIELRHAFQDRQFELHYQPIVDLRSGGITSLEALLRWRHPERGMISPAEFIPVAEEIGVISPLGEWVMRQACADAARWPVDVRVAINLSPIQLTEQNLVPLVVDALTSSGLAASRLEFEITEAVLIQNPEFAQRTLQELREVGVRIALDDFGTGYSSLSYLCRFPFDKIKIDRAFIRDLPNREPAAIVSAITGLARSLDMTTTAEGVETKQQLQQVKALGCTEIQGFLVSRARPAVEISRYFAAKGAARAQAGAA